MEGGGERERQGHREKQAEEAGKRGLMHRWCKHC